MTMGEQIKSLRIQHKMTQEELGKHLGIGRSAVLKYEKGEVENIPASKIQKMADLFGVTPSYLMCFDQCDEENLAKEVKLIESIQAKWGSDSVEMLHGFLDLNDEGKQKIVDLLNDLGSIPKYQKVQGRFKVSSR